MRIVFLGTPEFASCILDRLLQSEHEVVSAYTKPDKPAGRGQGYQYSRVKKTALLKGLPVVQPHSLKEDFARLASYEPDVIVVAAYGKILPSSILNLPTRGCINVHPSLLPRLRGPAPITGAILAGHKVTGVSIMLLDEGMDTGPILAQEHITILDHDTTGSLSNRLAEVGSHLLLETLSLWQNNQIVPRSQVNEQATYSKVITKEDGLVDWHLPAIELERMVRALQPWPGCYTHWQGKQLKIVEAVATDGDQTTIVGQVISNKQSQDTMIEVQTGNGVLRLLSVQLEGKKVMTVDEFERGHKCFVGAQLPH